MLTRRPRWSSATGAERGDLSRHGPRVGLASSSTQQATADKFAVRAAPHRFREPRWTGYARRSRQSWVLRFAVLSSRPVETQRWRSGQARPKKSKDPVLGCRWTLCP